ncbi:MAG: NAD-dependent epimerase/dehydratase family protein [Legionella sp.]|uniref:NAD-dependent epimerase/dehydratase family protein n=1 Tax=Legionella sp. TaxID=459 RepID=UPI0039E5D47A
MKRVLITGGTGALGQAVIEHLQSLQTYQIFITRSKMESSINDQISVYPCDFRNLDQLTTAFDLARPDLILHLGAAFTEDLFQAHQINVAPAAHLLDLVYQKKSSARVILIGSAAEYGIVKPEENPINEEHVLCPVSVYGLSKAWQTQLVGLYAGRGIDVLCLRIFNLFGPGISERLFAGRIQGQINKIKIKQKSSIEIGSLTAIRDYISTTEAARQLMMIASYGVSGNIYHIGSGQPVSMHDFLLEQLKLHGLPSSLICAAPEHSNRCGYDVPIIFADMQKTRNLEKNLRSRA